MIADEEMTAIIEVQAIFKNEFIEHIRGDHSENIDYIHTSGLGDFFAPSDVTSSEIRIKAAGDVVDRVLTEVEHITNFGRRCEDLF